MKIDKKYIDMLEYAYNKVPLYIKRNKQYEKGMEWEDIPILTKDEIQNDIDGFFSCEYISGKNSKYILKGRTSGSTGRYMDLYCHRNDSAKSLLTAWMYRARYYNIIPSDKMCYFYTSSNTGFADGIEYETEEVGNIKGFSKNNLTHERMLEIYEEMEKFKPIWLFIQPSMAVLLCDAAKETGRIIESIRYIEFTGEMLTDSVRERTEKIFGCWSSNHYGCNEVNTIAFECPHKNMHIASNFIYAEVVDEKGHVLSEGKEGRIIISSLTNKVTPYIRYDTGDIGKIYNNIKCACGCNSPVLSLTKGRVHENIELADGRCINAYIFVHAIEIINFRLEGCIKQFSIVQTDYDKFNVKLAVDNDIYELGVSKEAITKMFEKNVIHPEMSNAEYNFEICDRIFQDEGRKVLWFRKEM